MEQALRDERSSSITPLYRKMCIELGMLPDALYAWEGLHTQVCHSGYTVLFVCCVKFVCPDFSTVSIHICAI